MKILVTGAKGQLGFDIIRHLQKQGINFLGADKEEFDLTDFQATINYIRSYQPEAIIHCAAYTSVDNAEKNHEMCYNINVNGTKAVVLASQELKAKLMYLSTDYVFDGISDRPYEITDQKNPINYYGLTKSLGEEEVGQLNHSFIVRTSWLFGVNGNNFIKTMLKIGKEKAEVRVVNDQIGSPTYSYHLASLLVEMIKTTKYGLYHVTNEGFCSWYDLASFVMQASNLKCKVIPITSSEYPSIALRPHNSCLSKQQLLNQHFNPLPQWQDAVTLYLQEMEKENE